MSSPSQYPPYYNPYQQHPAFPSPSHVPPAPSLPVPVESKLSIRRRVLFILLIVVLIVSVFFNLVSFIFTRGGQDTSSLHHEIDDLNNKLSQEKKEKYDLISGSSTTQQINSLNRKLEDAKRENDDLKNLSQSGATAQKTINDLNVKVKDLRAELTTAKESLKHFQEGEGTTGAAREAQEKLKKELETANTELSKSQNQFKTLLEQSTREKDDSIREKKSLEGAIESLQKEFENRENVAWDKKRDTAISKSLIEEHDKSQKQNIQLQKELDRFQSGVEVIADSLSHMFTEIGEMKPAGTAEESFKNLKEAEANGVNKIILLARTLFSPEGETPIPEPPEQPPPLEKHKLAEIERGRLILKLDQLLHQYFTDETKQLGEIEDTYNSLLADTIEENQFKLPFSEYFEKVAEVKRKDNENKLESLISIFKAKESIGFKLGTFSKEMDKMKRDQVLPQNPFVYKKGISLENQLCQHFLDDLDRKCGIVGTVNSSSEEIDEAFELAKKVCNKADAEYSDLLKDYYQNRFNQIYNDFYENPSTTSMAELERVFACMKFASPTSFYPPFNSAQEMFCEHMEHLYLNGLFDNDFTPTTAVQDKLEFCPKSKVLTDLAGTLEYHIKSYIKSYVLRKFIVVVKKNEYLDDDQSFLENCIALHSILTGEKNVFDDMKSLDYRSYEKILMPNLELPERSNFDEVKQLILGKPPSKFFDYASRNSLRLSLDPWDLSPLNRYNLLSLISDDLKFLFWFFRADLETGSKIKLFIKKSSDILDRLFNLGRSDHFGHISSLTAPKIDINEYGIDVILGLLPFGHPHTTEEEFSQFHKSLWLKLISQHNDSLLKFLPLEILGIQSENVKQQLENLREAIKLDLLHNLPEDNPFAKVLDKYDSDSYRFLLLKCVYSRAQFYFPDDPNYASVPDTYAIETLTELKEEL